MGRAKIAMEFITKEKVRNVTYVKRKQGLLKKGREFSILCNVPVCIIMYPFEEGKQPCEPEVYCFKGNNPVDLGRVKDPNNLTREIIERYLAIPKEERVKRSLNLLDMFDEWTRKADQELNKLRHKNAMARYPNMSTLIDNFTTDQLLELLGHLDYKIGCVNQRIDMIKSNNSIEHNNKSGLAPVIDSATPVSSFIFTSSDHNNANQVDYHTQFGGVIDNGEVINQFPMYNYPMFSNNVQEGYQMGHFDPNPYSENKGSSIGHGHDNGVINNNNMVLYNYNMNMMYYNQGLSGVDDGGESSSYVAAMPMTTPLQLPKFSMPGKCHQQIFYE